MSRMCIFGSHAEGKLIGESEETMVSPSEPLEIPVSFKASGSECLDCPGLDYFKQAIRYSLGEESETEFQVCFYNARLARYHGRVFLLDGRVSPYDDLWQGEYFEGKPYTPVTEIVFTRRDRKTGEVLETLRMESVPGIIHDLVKEFGPEIRKPKEDSPRSVDDDPFDDLPF